MTPTRSAPRSAPASIAVLVVAAVCLTACSSSATPTSPPSDTAADAALPSAPPAQTVELGATVSLPADTVTVSAFLDPAAPKAQRPDTPVTHWASATVKQCATGPSRQGDWELALADGTTASEPTSWIEGELPKQLQPSDDPLAAGDCVAGDVYFVVPDGARTTGVVLASRIGNPARPQVTWTVT